jgi:hypothetical protein
MKSNIESISPILYQNEITYRESFIKNFSNCNSNIDNLFISNINEYVITE